MTTTLPEQRIVRAVAVDRPVQIVVRVGTRLDVAVQCSAEQLDGVRELLVSMVREARR